jgi:hypothetical protein|tara:strand:+ start:1252 stop:1443 length:192 start_codon:yes stop_codon:yes gene_type:complete
VVIINSIIINYEIFSILGDIIWKHIALNVELKERFKILNKLLLKMDVPQLEGHALLVEQTFSE